ncbi:MAG: ABC transporter permease, partial [Bacteroidales bacterium]
MLKNYLIIAFRNIKRNKVYSFINIVGLAMGVALFIIISLFIHSELSYDKFNENIDRIYRLDKDDWGILGTAYGPDAEENFPEVEDFVRFSLNYLSNPLVSVQENNKEQRIQNFTFADKQVFDIFTFKFIHGNAQNALQNPYDVVLTESVSKNLFGEVNPVGKTIKLDKKHLFTVTGVIEDIKRFHLNVNAIAEFTTLAKIRENPDFLEEYGSWNYPNYFLIKDGVNIADLNKKLSRHFEEYFRKTHNMDEEMNFHLTPMRDIYFDTETKYEIGVNHGNLRFIYVFIAIAVFILFIASINFINLTTAKAVTRAKEVGLRKVVGGRKKQLISQFLSESLLISLMAFILALGLVELLLPKFNNLLQGEITRNYFQEPFFWMIFLGGILIVGFVSGLYPSFYLTSFNPVSVMKGEQTRGKKGAGFRKALTVFQFFISVVLIIGTITIFQQINFMKKKDLGFEEEHQVYFSLTAELAGNKEAFKNELLKNPNIRGVTYTSQPAGRITWQESWKIKGETKQFTYQPVDPDYVDVMGLDMADGENFSWDRTSQKDRNAVIINEEAVRFFGLEDPVGIKLNTGSRFWDDVTVIGVLKDFHYNSLHKKIAPLVIGWDERGRTANVKISGNEIDKTINYMRTAWTKFVPDYPFEYHFLDEAFDRQYKDDERFGSLFTYFAFFAIFIACLGLYGLSLFATHQRKKEIGVRKANGARVQNIVQLFLKDFSVNVIIANLLAWPVAYFLMDYWLNNFPYRIEVKLWIFVVALIISLLIAVVTVSYNTIKAANTNPAYTLR